LEDKAKAEQELAEAKALLEKKKQAA